MNPSIISFDEYIKKFGLHINPIVRPTCLFEPEVSPPIIPREKTRDYFTVSRHEILSRNGFERALDGAYLVWYRKGPQGSPAEWNEENAKNLYLNSISDEKAYKPKSVRLIKKISNTLRRNGLIKDIEIICVGDELLHKTVIIDGTHRAIALHRISPSEFEDLLFQGSKKNLRNHTPIPRSRTLLPLRLH